LCHAGRMVIGTRSHSKVGRVSVGTDQTKASAWSVGSGSRPRDKGTASLQVPRTRSARPRIGFVDRAKTCLGKPACGL
jgi:hypothetical protein